MDGMCTVHNTAKSLSSASEISYIDPEVAKKLNEWSKAEMTASLLSSVPEQRLHPFMPTIIPLIKEERQGRSNSALYGELEQNCNDVTKLSQLMSANSLEITRFVEKKKNSLSLSTSAHSAALETIGAILKSIPDSELGISESNQASPGNSQSSTQNIESNTSAFFQLSTDIHAPALTPTTAKQPEASDALLSQTVLYGKDDVRDTTQVTVQHSPERTPEGTFIRNHSISLQSVASTGQEKVRPYAIREVPDEILGPDVSMPARSIHPSMLHMKHDAKAPGASPSQPIPWKWRTTVTMDNVPFINVKDYFADVEKACPATITALTEDGLATDNEAISRLQYEISAIRRFMNLNISARDAELARLDQELEKLKEAQVQQKWQGQHVPVIVPAPTSATAVVSMSITESQNKDLPQDNAFQSPFSAVSHLNMAPFAAMPVTDGAKTPVDSIQTAISTVMITPEIIESCFTGASGALPEVSSLSAKESTTIGLTNTLPSLTDAYKQQQSPLQQQANAAIDTANILQHSDSMDLIREYTTGNLGTLKQELIRTREEAMHIIRQKDAELEELRKNLAATKSVTSVPTSAGISMVSTLLDRPALISSSINMTPTDSCTSEHLNQAEKCTTPLPPSISGGSLQMSSYPTSATSGFVTLPSVTNPSICPAEPNTSSSSAKTVVHSGEYTNAHRPYSISVSSTSAGPLSHSVSVTEDMGSISSKLETSHLRLALSSVAKSGTIPPKPPLGTGFYPQVGNSESSQHEYSLPSPSFSRSGSMEQDSRQPPFREESRTPMSASPANIAHKDQGASLSVPKTSNLHVTFANVPNTNSTGVTTSEMMHTGPWPRPAPYQPYDPILTPGSTPSTNNSSYLNDVDTGDQRDDEFLQLEHKVRVTQSQLMRSLASTYLSDTYRSGDFAATTLDTFLVPPYTYSYTATTGDSQAQSQTSSNLNMQ